MRRELIAPEQGAEQPRAMRCDSAQSNPTTFVEAAPLCPHDRRFLPKLAKHFGRIRLDEISTQAIALGEKAVYPRAKLRTTIRQYWGPIKRFFEWCAREGFCEPPIVKIPRPPKGHPPHILTIEEEARLIFELPDHARPFVMFLLSTGCLVAEARRLQWRQLYPKRREVWFPKRGKRDSRYAPLDKDVLAEFKSLLQRDGLVFRKSNGEVYSAKRVSCVDKSAFGGACDRAGLVGVTQQNLRFTWAARELARGCSVREVS
jgi:integrase